MSDSLEPTCADTPDDDLWSRRRFVARGALGLSGLMMLGARSTWAQSAPSTPAANSSPKAVTPTVPNRAPLAPTPFVALPLGSVRARGWLLRQLELQRDGLTGHAEEVLPAVGADSAWLGGKGEDWEKGPYYVKGLVALAYSLDDADLKAKAQRWVDAILASQRPDGSIGPKTNQEWWPRMLVTYLLRDYAEATGDARVVPFLARYYQYMAKSLDSHPLHEWARARAGDEIETILWLYNRTGDASLLPLTDKLAAQAYPWRDIFTNNRFLEFGGDFQPKHNVNVPQALKLPAVYFQRSHDEADRRAYALGLAHLLRDHGLACGIESGTEFLAGNSTTQGIELCSVVERMLSDETNLRILGDAAIGDNLELVAFNALPAATTRSLCQHVYYTVPNNVTAPRGGLGFNQDYGDARTPAPRSGFPCCCYNLHMGWPKLTQNSWAATHDGGVATLVYVPSQATVNVAGGVPVTWTQETNYPFGEEVRFKLTSSAKVRFPFALRVPAWCKTPALTVNGQPAGVTLTPGTFATITREWSPGDELVLRLPMAVELHPGVNRSTTVRHGPLVYSLLVQENRRVLEPGPLKGFESFEVTSGSAWNYALDLDPRNPAGSFTVRRAAAAAANPFEPAQTPVTLQVRARKLPDWALAWDGRAPFDPPVSPVQTDAPAETLTLAPFGSQMLRVTNFPVVGAPLPPASEFRDGFALGNFVGWIPYGGGWFVRDGALHAASNAGSGSDGLAGVKAIATQTHFADFTCEATVSVGGQGNAGLAFRVSNAAIGPDAYKGYYVGISAERGEVELGKSDNRWTSLGAVRRAFTADTSYHLRVEARGPRLRVFVEDMTAPILEATDNTYAAGSIGVRHYNTQPDRTRAAFSKLTVTAV